LSLCCEYFLRNAVTSVIYAINNSRY
jgi:hypothetical protein